MAIQGAPAEITSEERRELIELQKKENERVGFSHSDKARLQILTEKLKQTQQIQISQYYRLAERYEAAKAQKEFAGEKLGIYDRVRNATEAEKGSHRLQHMDSLPSEQRGELKPGDETTLRQIKEEKMHRNKALYEGRKTRHEAMTREKGDKESKAGQAKDKKDEDAWSKEEKAYERNPLPNAAAVVEAWNKIIPPYPIDAKQAKIPEDVSMLARESGVPPDPNAGRYDITKQEAARKFARGETDGFIGPQPALPRHHKELARDFKNEFRGLTPVTRETSKKGVVLKVDPMGMLEKEAGEKGVAERLVGNDPHKVFVESVKEAKKAVESSLSASEVKVGKFYGLRIPKHKVLGDELKIKWHQLLRPFAPSNKERNAKIEKDCGVKEVKKKVRAPSGAYQVEVVRQGVVRACLEQPYHKQEPLHTMLEAKKLYAAIKKQERDKAKEAVINSIVAKMSKLTVSDNKPS